ncbi:MAG: acyl-CoA/acyl-ACP dehydrogenase [Chloroflexi bacterium]|nr:acyl-CoA/acyl-ACP dehydrogenase [Chloroflexota bacterium]
MTHEQDAGASRQAEALLRETAARFVARECSPEVVARLEEDPLGYAPEHWRRLAELGWLGLLVPEEHGGAGVSLRELATVVGVLGAAGLPSPLFATVVEAGTLIALAGEEQQRRRWLPALAGGEALLSAALLEPGADIAPSAVQMRATAFAGGFRLRGQKLFVPYAHVASHLVCLVRADDAPQGLSLLLVPRVAPGVQLTRLRTTNGDPQFAVAFTDVDVPRSALLSASGAAWPHVEATLDRGAALKCAELVALGQRALDLTLAFVRERTQFGQPIGRFQAVHHHCADMSCLLEQARVLTAQAIWRLADGREAAREVALAKVKASEGIPALLRMAHQLHGGVGYYTNYPLEMLYRRSMAAAAVYGSARWHRRRLAHLLATDAARFRRAGAHPLPPTH